MENTKINIFPFLPGATKISCFFVRIRKNVKSFCGSKSLTQLFALSESVRMRPVNDIVVELSIVERTKLPVFHYKIKQIQPIFI